MIDSIFSLVEFNAIKTILTLGQIVEIEHRLCLMFIIHAIKLISTQGHWAVPMTTLLFILVDIDFCHFLSIRWSSIWWQNSGLMTEILCRHMKRKFLRGLTWLMNFLHPLCYEYNGLVNYCVSWFALLCIEGLSCQVDVNIIKRRSHIIWCSEVRVFSAENLVVLHNWEVLHARSDDVLDLWGKVLGLEPTAFC